MAKKAIARYSMEIDDLTFDVETKEFSEDLDQYVIDTMAEYMHQYYQERYYSLVNKRVSIVTKELSIDGNNGSKLQQRMSLMLLNIMLKNDKQSETYRLYIGDAINARLVFNNT